jgi:hypothetical protein
MNRRLIVEYGLVAPKELLMLRLGADARKSEESLQRGGVPIRTFSLLTKDREKTYR